MCFFWEDRFVNFPNYTIRAILNLIYYLVCLTGKAKHIKNIMNRDWHCLKYRFYTLSTFFKHNMYHIHIIAQAGNQKQAVTRCFFLRHYMPFLYQCHRHEIEFDNILKNIIGDGGNQQSVYIFILRSLTLCLTGQHYKFCWY